MKLDVEIKCTIRKTYRGEGETYDEAVADAHEQFSVLNDGVFESYDQDALEITEVTDE